MKIRLALLCLPALLSMLALAACGSDDAKKDDDKQAEDSKEPKPKKIEDPTPICPQTGAVRELSLMRDYGGNDRAPQNLIAAARMTGVVGDCSYHDDGIDLSFEIDMIAKRGPGAKSLHATFPVFVAVMAPDGTVENKLLQQVEFGFASDDNFANAAQSMHVFIPLPKDRQKTGPYYRVLSGFQLTKAQEEDANQTMAEPVMPTPKKPSVPAPPHPVQAALPTAAVTASAHAYVPSVPAPEPKALASTDAAPAADSPAPVSVPEPTPTLAAEAEQPPLPAPAAIAVPAPAPIPAAAAKTAQPALSHADAEKALAARLPKDVAAFLYRQKMCYHWNAQVPYDAASNAEINKAKTKLQCDNLDKMEANLRRDYAYSSTVLDALNASRLILDSPP